MYVSIYVSIYLTCMTDSVRVDGATLEETTEPA